MDPVTVPLYRSQLQAGGNVDIHGQPEAVDEHDDRVGKSAKLSGKYNCHCHGRKIARKYRVYACLMYAMLGRCYSSTGHNDKAIGLLEQALRSRK